MKKLQRRFAAALVMVAWATSTTVGQEAPPSPKELETWSKKAISLRQEARYAVTKWEWVVASSKYLEAVKLFEKISSVDRSPKQRLMLADTMREYGRSNINHNQPNGEKWCRRALDLAKEILGPKDPEIAEYLFALAEFVSKRDPAEGEKLYKEELQIRRTAGKDCSTTLCFLGSLYSARREHAKAEAFYLEAETESRARGNEMALSSALSALAGIYAKTKPDVARANISESISILRRIRSSTHPSLATALSKFADLEPNREKGIELAEEANTILASAPVVPYRIIFSHLQLGWMYHFRGYGDKSNLEKSIEHFRKALMIHRKAVSDPSSHHVESAFGLACCLHRKGEHVEAEKLMRLNVEDSIRYHELASLTQSEETQMWSMEDDVRFLHMYFPIAEEAGIAAEEIYEVALRWKGIVTRRQMLIREARRAAAHVDEKTRRRFADLEAVARAYANASSRTDVSGREAKLEALNSERLQIEADLSEHTASFRRSTNMNKVRSSDIRRALPAGAALVDYLVYRQYTPSGPKGSCLAFIVRSQGVEIVELGPVDPVLKSLETYLAGVRRGFVPTHKGSPAMEVRDYFWTPVESKLGSAKIVAIAPDQIICSIPFAALPNAEGTRYLIEDYAFVHLTSPQALPHLMTGRRSSRDSEARLLAVGDVDFDNSESTVKETSVPNLKPSEVAALRSLTQGAGWTRLPATKDEAIAVQDLFKRAVSPNATSLLQGKEATEAAFRKLAGQYRFLHVASHGYFAPSDKKGSAPGLSSGIVFAGANRISDSGDDGLMTALELATLDLFQVDLAVLSACETSLGVAGTTGEGVVGLQRALHVAGVRTACTSLWTVDDEATRHLMERFYRNHWTKKLGALESLREAQLWMLNEGKMRLSESSLRGIARLGVSDRDPDHDRRLPPSLWAAFILSGDWR